jgi:regulatory protein
MDSLVRLLSARERSVQEAHKRLAEKGFDSKASSEAVNRALDCGLLDDQRFAKRLIEVKIAAGWGEYRINQELYRFGIPKDSIEGYPEAFFAAEDQLERALQALKKHRSRAKNPRQAAFKYLISRGFDSEIAGAAVKARHSEL